MPYIVWSAGLFTGDNREESEEIILKLLAVLVDQNCKYLRSHPDTPKLYDLWKQGRVEYALPDQLTRAPDPDHLARLAAFLRDAMGCDDETIDIVQTVLKGCEIFRDIPVVLKKKRVDCDNLSAFRVAELRVGGVEAVPYIIWRETPRGTTYHALLRHPDGTSEDPSIILGMGGEQKAAERAEEQRKNRERRDKLIQTAAALYLDPALAGRRIDALGYLPKGGAW